MVPLHAAGAAAGRQRATLDAVVAITGGNLGGDDAFAIDDVLLRFLAPGVERS